MIDRAQFIMLSFYYDKVLKEFGYEKIFCEHARGNAR